MRRHIISRRLAVTNRPCALLVGKGVIKSGTRSRETIRGISPQSGRRSLAPGVAKRNPGTGQAWIQSPRSGRRK